MDVEDALAQLGGAADKRALCALSSRRAVRSARAAGRIAMPRLGYYSLPVLDDATAAVQTTNGVRSHLSAALHHGWEVKRSPAQPQVTVPRGRRLAPQRRVLFGLRWAPVSQDELEAGVTTPLRTVLDCARHLPFDEALAVADSALRSGLVDRRDLLEAAARSPRTGRPAALRIARAADSRAANPFESALRAIALDVAGLEVEPQVEIADRAGVFLGRVDLADVTAGIVIEADSWTHHAGRAAFDSDVRRYTSLVRAGWRVVRFLWPDVMDHPALVRAVLQDLVR